MKYYLFLVPLLFLGCVEDSSSVDFEIEGTVWGYKPIYADSADLTLDVEPPREIELAGKIYSYGTLLLVNEVGKGIHIYDNKDPKNPINRLFVRVPGSNDMAMRNGVLYVDNYNDLVALKITDDTVRVVKRIPDVMGFSAEFPNDNNVYFECVDESKGIVVGWERSDIENPKCYRP